MKKFRNFIIPSIGKPVSRSVIPIYESFKWGIFQNLEPDKAEMLECSFLKVATNSFYRAYSYSQVPKIGQIWPRPVS